MAITPQQREALRSVIDAILASVKAAGPGGASDEVLSAAVMAQGATLEEYRHLMDGLVSANVLRRIGDSYFVGPTASEATIASTAALEAHFEVGNRWQGRR